MGIIALKLVEQIDTTLGELTIYGPERRLEAIKDINRQNEALSIAMVDFAKDQGLEGFAEKVAYHGTSLVLDTALINKAATALNTFATVANASMAEVAHEVANAATKAPALEAITAEGIAIKVPQSAEICALSEAQEGVKQSGKINNAHKAIKNSSLKENIEKYINNLEIYRKKFQKFNIEIYKDQIKHIANSHYPNGARFVHNLENNGIRASTFFENENFLDIALETLECKTKSGSNLITYDCKRVIGLDQLGNPTSKITLALNSDRNRILTIFPT